MLIRIAAGADEGITMAALRLAGANVHSRLGPIATAEVPIRAVGALAALESVVSMELARPLVSRLNISVPSTGAGTLRSGAAPNWSGLTGKGVIVGVVDDGIDFRHRDFRNLDGTTRLLALWDQRDAGTSGQPPAGQAYGGECTVGMLNAAIAGDAEPASSLRRAATAPTWEGLPRAMARQAAAARRSIASRAWRPKPTSCRPTR
ncbi:MAG: hypothetical protein IPI73_05580 [Betaproteobacteria bacterium]|nr:hypothetical protein [Betaproteobacteria bacterium]